MKGIVIIVFVVLVSVTYGTKFCEVTKKENDKCGNNGKCTISTCTPLPTPATATTPAPAATPAPAPAATPAVNATTPAPATTKAPASTTPAVNATTPASTTPAPSGRKRRGAVTATAVPTIADCNSKCVTGQVCRYKCTGESGSIKHGLSPLVLLVGVLTKLFLVG